MILPLTVLTIGLLPTTLVESSSNSYQLARIKQNACAQTDRCSTPHLNLSRMPGSTDVQLCERPAPLSS